MNSNDDTRLFPRLFNALTSSSLSRCHPPSSTDHRGGDMMLSSAEANNSTNHQPHHHHHQQQQHQDGNHDDYSDIHKTLFICNTTSSLSLNEMMASGEDDDTYSATAPAPAAAIDHPHHHEEPAITCWQQQYEICETIDDSMLGLHLHAFPSTPLPATATNNTIISANTTCSRADTAAELTTKETTAPPRAIHSNSLRTHHQEEEEEEEEEDVAAVGEERRTSNIIGNEAHHHHHRRPTQQHFFDYDWILDGSVDDDDDHDEEKEEEEIERNDRTTVQRKQRQIRRQRKCDGLGNTELDRMLRRMELESSRSSASSSSSCDDSSANSFVSRTRRRRSSGSGSNSIRDCVLDGENDDTIVKVSTEEEMAEFADFSSAFSTDDDMAICNMARQEEIVGNSIESFASRTGIIPQSTLQSCDVNVVTLSPAVVGGKDGDDDKDEVEEIKSPQSMECRVPNLDAELDAAISNRLYLRPDESSDVAGENSTMREGNDCENVLEVMDVEMSQQMKITSPHQSLLMSSMLLESLPLPMPSSLPDDLVASFTRRIQKYHITSQQELCCEFDAARSTVHIQDEELVQMLSDTIHCGYFEDEGSDFFDPIVMEEIMNIPWPFHVLDVNESFLNDEESDDPDADEQSVDDIHFDTYISNRLTELDFASGKIMDCLLSRVYQQEEAINNGVENIFAAEVSISTAILYSNSCRKFLYSARKGYQLSSTHHDLTGQHNVISGSLDILRIADNKDRLQRLLGTVDDISSMCDKEVQWLHDISTNVIAHQRFKKILADAKGLNDMVSREEVLNRVTCLYPMRVRLNRLHEVLLERVEESFAHLISRVLQSDENNAVSFDEYRTEYESIFDAWISCFHVMSDNEQSAHQSQLNAIETAWSACIIKILCFEVKKAVAFSIIDTHLDERLTMKNNENKAIEEIQMQLCQTKLNLINEVTLESLPQRLMSLRGENRSRALSSPFFHLGSRLVELMNLFNMTLYWLESLITRADAANEPLTFMLPLRNGYGLSHSDDSVVSFVTSENQSSSSADDESKEENIIKEASSWHVPESVEFERFYGLSTLDEYTTVLKVTKCIRRKIWEHCELALIQLVECYLSQATRVATEESKDSATRNFRSTFDVLMQLNAFSSYFLSEVDGSNHSSGLESALSKVYLIHLRSVHVEAMKTTGTILRHEAWQLAPLELPKFAAMSYEKNCKCTYSQKYCAPCKEAIMKSLYQAVGDIILGSVHDNIKPEFRRLITERAERRGYLQLSSFRKFLDNLECDNSDNVQRNQWRVQGCGIASDGFASIVLPFVELNDCGERSISILTQSSSNGLVRWAARLLSIGNALPLVSKDASAAVMTLLDLYVLTVLRFCAGSKLNEDVLIGFGRGSAANSAASTLVSITIEADAVAPLPRERRAFVQTQEFITSSRNRLKDIVNLDKFQSSSDTCPTSPRSKNAVSKFARRLEKEAAAACSYLFVAVLVDVATTIFSDRKDQLSHQQVLWADLKDMETSIENQDNYTDLKQYAAKFVAVVPHLVAQTTRFAAANSISGKELIFQVICCGRTYENQNMQEHSNAYVDGLCDRVASLWGHLSSSTILPPPALHYVWNQLVWSSFMLLLEGFSKVNCSMEGRSLMSMDLATLSHGLMPETVMAELDDDYSGIGPPPQSCREEMMRYVDTFIKVFYFPHEDILNWIKGNAKDYHLDHSMSLIKASGTKDKNFVSQGTQAIDAIYYEHSR